MNNCLLWKIISLVPELRLRSNLIPYSTFFFVFFISILILKYPEAYIRF
jgi:hypothetical protein